MLIFGNIPLKSGKFPKKMHFFGIFFQKNLDDCRKSTTFALANGKQTPRKHINHSKIAAKVIQKNHIRK